MIENHGHTSHGRPAAGHTRPLPPGGGRRLRGVYLTLLLVALVALVVILPFIWYTAIASIGDDDLPLLAFGAVVVTASAILLVTALISGRAAVHGDAVAVVVARTSARLAHAGGLTGWIGAAAVLMLAVVLAMRDVDLALVKGISLVVASLIPALFNDRARRIADTAAG